MIRPRRFQGALRDYQQHGLGWLHFLRDLGLGGCLADDMGLGKTVQVLALLEERRCRRLKRGETRLPSLVVVPKSLVFNWIDEAQRFTPQLRVLNYTGLQRAASREQLDDAHLIVTTYGTVRHDIVELESSGSSTTSFSTSLKPSRMPAARWRRPACCSRPNIGWP